MAVGTQIEGFHQVYANEINARSLRDEMNSLGYVLIKGVLPVADLNCLVDEILSIVAAAGWLLPGHDPRDRMAHACAACGPDDADYKEVYKQIFNMESFHAFAHHPALRQVMQLLAGPRLLVHPKSVLRMIFPSCERALTPAHQDHAASAGDPETFTMWMPLHDCPIELGPLRILEASHHFGLQKTLPGSGHVALETARGIDWVEGTVEAGDVLIFHSLTVHAAAPNTSRQLRVSMDCRFQDYGRPFNPAALVFAGGSAGGRSWETIYEDWRSDDLKYYWKRIPLNFKPSLTELAELARAADDPEMRARYARILSCLREQYELA
jgi:hypothetical protein